MRARLEEWPDLPVIGWGHRPTAWPDNPTVSDLDAIGTDLPIVLIAGDGHHGWLNTIALHMLALPIRDSVVSEAEWFMAYGRLASVLGQDGTGPDAYRRSMEAAAAQGVVGLVDLEFSGGVADWAARWAGGADLLRIRHACYADGLDDVLARGLRSGDPLADDPRLTMGPLKIISDGSLNTRTAWCCEPYAEKAVPGFEEGQPNQTPATSCGRCWPAPRPAGSRSPCTPSATARSPRRSPPSRRPAPAAASSTCSSPRVTTYAAWRASASRASVQPAHLLDDRDVTERLWPGRAERCFPLRWMLDAGVDVVLGSDAPVSPLDPWLAVASRGPPLRRRPRAVAPRAGDHRPRGARRLDRRLGHGRRRAPRRPGAPRRRPPRRGVGPRARAAAAGLRRPRRRDLGRRHARVTPGNT